MVDSVETKAILYSEQSANEQRRLRERYQTDYKAFLSISTRVETIQRSAFSNNAELLPLIESLNIATENLSKYYLSVFSPSEPLPAFVKQKHLETFLLREAQKTETAYQKLSQASKKAVLRKKFNSYFSNTYFLDRLMLGKGSTNYAKKHDVYASKAAEFIPSLFEMTRHSNDQGVEESRGVRFKGDPNFLNQARNSIYQYMNKPSSIIAEVDLKALEETKQKVDNTLRTEWEKFKSRFEDNQNILSHLQNITDAKRSDHTKEFIFESLKKGFEDKLKNPDIEKTAEDKVIYSILSNGWDAFNDLLNEDKADSLNKTEEYKRLHTAIDKGIDKRAWGEDKEQMLLLEKIKKLEELPEKTAEQTEELNKLKKYVYHRPALLSVIDNSGNPFANLYNQSVVDDPYILADFTAYFVMLNQNPRPEWLGINDVVQMMVFNPVSVGNAILNNPQTFFDSICPLGKNGIRDTRVLDIFKKFKTYGISKTVNVPTGRYNEHNIEIVESVNLFDRLIELSTSLEKKNEVKSNQKSYYSGDFKNIFLEFKNNATNHIDDKAKIQSDNIAKLLENGKGIKLPADVKQKDLLFWINYNLDAVETLVDERVKRNISDKVANTINDPEILVRIFLGKGSANYADRAHREKYVKEASKLIFDLFNAKKSDGRLKNRSVLLKNNIVQFFNQADTLNLTAEERTNIKKLQQVAIQATEFHWNNLKQHIDSVTSKISESARTEMYANGLEPKNLESFVEEVKFAQGVARSEVMAPDTFLYLQPILFSTPKPSYIDNETLAKLILFYPATMYDFLKTSETFENVFVSNGEKSHAILDLVNQYRENLGAPIHGKQMIKWDIPNSIGLTHSLYLDLFEKSYEAYPAGKTKQNKEAMLTSKDQAKETVKTSVMLDLKHGENKKSATVEKITKIHDDFYQFIDAHRENANTANSKALKNLFNALESKIKGYTFDDIKIMYAYIAIAKESVPKPGFLNKVADFLWGSKHPALVLDRMQTVLETKYPTLSKLDKSLLKDVNRKQYTQSEEKTKAEQSAGNTTLMLFKKRFPGAKLTEQGIEMTEIRQLSSSKPKLGSYDLLRKEYDELCNIAHQNRYTEDRLFKMDIRGLNYSKKRYDKERDTLVNLAKMLEIPQDDKRYIDAITKIDKNLDNVQNTIYAKRTVSYKEEPALARAFGR